MSLNINDINIDLFTEYFSNNLLGNVESDLITLPINVAGVRYTLGYADNLNTYNNTVFYSPVPLNFNNGVLEDDTVSYLFRNNTFPKSNKYADAGKYDDAPSLDARFTEILETVDMPTNKPLYHTPYLKNNLYDMPSYSEYSIYIKNNISSSNILNEIVPHNESTYKFKIPVVKIYNLDTNISQDSNMFTLYQSKDDVNQNDISTSTFIAGGYNARTSTLYKILTLFDVADGYYDGNMNLDFVLYDIITKTPPVLVESDGIFYNSNIRYLLSPDKDNYNIWILIDGSTQRDKLLHVGILVKNSKSVMPDFNVYGQPLFKDKYNNITTVSSTPSQFIKYNQAIRENFYSLTASESLASFLFAPNLIGLCQVGDNYKFIQTTKFNQTYKFELIDKENIPAYSEIKRAILNPKTTELVINNGDFTYSKIVRYTEDVLNFNSLKRLLYFNPVNEESISNLFNKDNTFYILDEERVYNTGDIVLLDEVDPGAKTKVINSTKLGVITDIDNMFRSKDLIGAKAVTDIANVANLTPLRYLTKTNNSYSFGAESTMDGITSCDRILYYQNSLQLNQFYKITETWSTTLDESAVNQSPPSNFSNWEEGGIPVIKYEKSEFLKYSHMIIDDTLINWTSAPDATKIAYTDIFNSSNGASLLFYKKRFGNKNFDIIRILNTSNFESSNVYKNSQTSFNYTKVSPDKAMLINNYIELFTEALHYIQDGYLESRGKLLVPGKLKEYEISIFRSLLTDKLNSLEDIQFPIISEFDADRIMKYKVITEGVMNFTLKNNVKSTYNYSRTIYPYTFASLNMDMVLKEITGKEEPLQLSFDDSMYALASVYNKNVFQRIHEYSKYPTNYIKTNSLKDSLGQNKLYKNYDSLTPISNDALVLASADIKNRGDIEQYYELVANTIITSLKYNNSDSGTLFNYFNNVDYNKIMSFKYNEIEEQVQKSAYISSTNIIDGLDTISNAVKLAFGKSTLIKGNIWEFNDIDRNNMILNYGGPLWEM